LRKFSPFGCKRIDSATSPYRKAFNEERAALGLPLIGQDGGRPVQAELNGQAEVKGEAKVTITIPGTIPGLGDRDVRVPLRGTFSANGPGSLDVSSPDAVAHPVEVQGP